MKIKSFVVVFLCVLASLMCLQGLSAQMPNRTLALRDQMKANVALIPASAEKDRWMVNIDMWQIMTSNEENPPIWQLAVLRNQFRQMQANVAAINEPEEKERWLANVFMWDVMIRHMDGDTNPRLFGQLRAFLARMQTNVARIAEPSEKERWEANVDVWRIMIGVVDRAPVEVAAVRSSR